MPQSCCVLGCTNSSAKTECQEKGVKFFAFPTRDPEQREKWIAAVKRIEPDGKPWTPKSHMICSEHFVGGEWSRTRGHPSYLPAIFPTKSKSNGHYCCVVGCSNNSKCKAKGVKLFSIPTRNLEQRELWLKAINRQNKDGNPWLPRKWTKICSAHFVGGKPSPTREAFISQS